MLVIEPVRDRNKFFIPAIIARLVATNQQNKQRRGSNAKSTR
jgi:hypothetical protein